MMNQFRLALLLLFSSLTITAQNTTNKVIDLIEKDYLSLLKGMIELKNEIRSTSDRNVLEELKQAKSLLIKDYTNGPFAIFESNAVCQTGYIKTSDRYSEDRIDAFLLNYAGKNFQNVFLDVEKVEKSKYNKSWYEVSFVSQGEVSGTITQRTAIISVINDTYKIRKLSFAGAPHNDEVIADRNIKEKTAEPAKIKLAAKQKEEPVPTISLISIDYVSPEVVKVTGNISQAKNQGALTATSEGNSISSLTYNETKHEFKFDLSMSKNKSQEIYLTYNYGDKFIQLRKNIVLFRADRIDEPISDKTIPISISLTSRD